MAAWNKLIWSRGGHWLRTTCGPSTFAMSETANACKTATHKDVINERRDSERAGERAPVVARRRQVIESGPLLHTANRYFSRSAIEIEKSVRRKSDVHRAEAEGEEEADKMAAGKNEQTED